MRYSLFYLLFLFFGLMRLPAQPHQQYFFSHLGTRQGLASDEVMGVQQDKKGFIWIATVNGLQRYDGRRLFTFRHKENDPASIPDNAVLGIYLDKKERLWLLCNENRVGYMNVSDFSFHEVPVRMQKNTLQRSAGGLLSDGNGNIMLGIGKTAVLTFNEAADEFSVKYTPFLQPAGWKIAGLFQDRSFNYWIACDSGLAKYNPLQKTLSYRGHNKEQDPVIQAYADLRFVAHPYFDASGRFWLASWWPNGPGPFLYSYDTANKKIKEWESSLFTSLKLMYHEVQGIKETDDGTLWLMGLNVFAALPKKSNDFEIVQNNLPGEFSIRYDRIKTLFQDKERSIWVSSDKGLYRFNTSAQLFHIVNNRVPGNDSIYTPDVTDLLQTGSNEILVSTWGNGLFAYDNNFRSIPRRHIKDGAKLGEALTWCIHQRPNGDIWRGGQDGFIFITQKATGQTIRIRPPAFEETTVRQIAEDKNGNLWIGSHRGHLVKWDAAGNTFELVHKLSTIYRLYTDKKGDIWICTGSNGAIRLDPATGSIIANYTSTGSEGKKLSGIGAADIIQYDDSMYIIASGSLNILNSKTGQIRFFDTDNGLPSNSVNNIIRDKKGFLWVTTESQLCRLGFEKSITSLFTEADGLPPSTYNVASSVLLSDGRIAIGRTHDFIVFDPNNIAPDSIPVPAVEITGFALMNSWLSIDSLQKLPEIRLRYNQNSVIIEFSTLTYLNQFGVYYMMEGLDKDWINAGGTNQAIYNYLPPGNYTFKIKADNGETQPLKITTLTISVRTPFWKTWWFYSVMALLAAAFFYWDDRERIHRKTALQEMRSNIASNLHEEIHTALNNINVLSEIARIKADKDPEQSKTYINEIHHKSHNMIIAMDDMLWSIDPANDSMGKTIDRIKEFAASLRNRHEVIINLQTDEKVASLKPDMKKRHEVMIIYKLALRLLVEEMKSPQTSIHLGYLKSQLQLNIFSREVKLGDNNNQVIKMIEEMKTRAASIPASLEIQSDEKGSAIILAVKV